MEERIFKNCLFGFVGSYFYFYFLIFLSLRKNFSTIFSSSKFLWGFGLWKNYGAGYNRSCPSTLTNLINTHHKLKSPPPESFLKRKIRKSLAFQLRHNQQEPSQLWYETTLVFGEQQQTLFYKEELVLGGVDEAHQRPHRYQ